MDHVLDEACSLAGSGPKSGLLGYLAAIFALVSQLALGSIVIPDDAIAAQRSALAAASILCSHDAPQTPTHRHHAPLRTLCPLSVTLAPLATILTPMPALPIPPPLILIRRAALPPSRGPPPPTAYVGQPRAPPILT